MNTERGLCYHISMTQKRTIESSEWTSFLDNFSSRNRGRRARFEIFHTGTSKEEQQEGHFENITIDGRVVTVNRSYESRGEQKNMTDEVADTHGIVVQIDTDGSEDTLEFSNHNGDLTVLHFESLVDGDS